MSEKYTVDHFCFENRDVYERAVKEEKVIKSMREKYHLSNGKTAWKIYQKAVEEKVFTTVVGYSFLNELWDTIRKSSAAAVNKLPDIPVKAEGTADAGPVEAGGIKRARGDKYQRLYEGQCLLNKRLKIIVLALVILIVAFVVIDLKSEYSVFTYFTDYKAKMEEELYDKYEAWENELKAREDALEQKE